MRAFRIPAALLVVASLALLGCGDIAGPSVEAAPQFQNGDPGDQGNGEGDQGNGEGDQGNGEGDQG